MQTILEKLTICTPFATKLIRPLIKNLQSYIFTISYDLLKLDSIIRTKKLEINKQNHPIFLFQI